MKYTNIEKLQKLYESNISRPGFERVIELLRLLDNPQDKIRCIHVAGTNGKGSTCAYIESILRNAGYKTALFTSPHINRLNEYLSINNKLISNKQLGNYAGQVLSACKSMLEKGYEHPTFFEIMVAMAFKYFYEEKVDVAIIEVGMGGEDDATNVITPILSVITTIGLDHTKILGNTIKKIAKHKAGIIKENIPVIVSAMQQKDATCVFMKKSKKLNSKYINAGKYKVKEISSTIDSQHINIFNDTLSYDICLKSLGKHQINNAITAIATVEELNNCGYEVKINAIQKGLEQTFLPNRIEYIKDKNIIIDNSHNPQGVRELRNIVEKYFDEKKKILVCSILNTKDADSMICEYKKFVDYAFITQSTNTYSLKFDELSNKFKDYDILNTACENINEAMKLAILKSKDKDAILIVSGSSYIISDVRRNINL